MESIFHIHYFDLNAKKDRIGYRHLLSERRKMGFSQTFQKAQALPDIGREPVDVDAILKLPLAGRAANHPAICDTINWCRALNWISLNLENRYLDQIRDLYREATNSRELDVYKDFHLPRCIYSHAWFVDSESINLHFFIDRQISIDAATQDNLNRMPFVQTEQFYSLFLKSMEETSNRWIVKHPVGERLTLWYSYMLAFSAVTGINTSKLQGMITGNNHRNLRNVNIRPGQLNSVSNGNLSKPYQMYLERIFLDMINGRKVI